MTATPEFSHPLTLDAARRTRAPVALHADAAERDALARRFDLLGIEELAATLTIKVTGQAIEVTGAIRAAVTQSCVATATPVLAQIEAPVALRLVPGTELATTTEDAEIELADADLDVVDYDGAVIDLGEIVAQTLALALDPWPRSPDADAVLRAAGVKSESEAGAFAALAALLKPAKD